MIAFNVLPEHYRVKIEAGWTEESLLSFSAAERLMGRPLERWEIEHEYERIHAQMTAAQDEKRRIFKNIERLSQSARVCDQVVTARQERGRYEGIIGSLKRTFTFLFGKGHQEEYERLDKWLAQLSGQLRACGVANEADLRWQRAVWEIQATRLPTLEREVEALTEPLNILRRAVAAFEHEHYR